MTPHETQDLAIEVAKGMPAVAGATASAITLNAVVMCATALYIIIQALYLLRKWYSEEIDREYDRHRQRQLDARDDAEWIENHQAKAAP